LDRALNRAAFERRPIIGALARLVRPDADSRSRRDQALRSLRNAASVNTRYLSTIDQRLATIQFSPASPSSLPPVQAPVVAADPRERDPSTARRAASLRPDMTPDLDHLRKKSRSSKTQRRA